MANKFKSMSGSAKGYDPMADVVNQIISVPNDAGLGRKKIVNIDMDSIVPNERNDYSIEDIEQLAQLIKLSGDILQPLIVNPQNEDDSYTLTTGERRWRAARLLRDRGEWPEKFNNTVPCVIRDPRDMELRLSDESKELLSIMVTNQYRQKKEKDELMEIRNWKKIFAELRERGEEFIPEELSVLAGRAQYDEEGQVIPEPLQGEKTRDLVANYAHIASGTVAKYERIDREGNEALVAGLLNEEISLNAADKVAKLPKEDRKEILKEGRTKRVEVKDVDRYIEKKEAENKNREVTRESFEQDVEELRNVIPQQGIKVSETQYRQYEECMQGCLKKLKKIFG